MRIIKSLGISRSWFYIPFTLLYFGVSTSALAEVDYTGTYWGVQFSDSTDKFEADSGGTTKKNRGHVKGKYGKALNEYVSVEGQFGITTSSNSTRGIYTYGAYLRASKDLGDYKIYGLLGASGLQAYDDDFDDVSESSGSYGVGIEIFGSKTTAITIEYLQMVDKSLDDGDFTFDTLGLGFTYYFVDDQSYFNKNRNKIRSIRY